MAGEIRTQGTEIFRVNAAGTAIQKIGNVVGLGDFGPEADDIETTNLDSVRFKEFITGLADNGEATLQINIDPQNQAHRALAAEAGTGERTTYVIAYSDGVSLPTVTTGTVTLPDDRSFTSFLASVKSFRRSVTTNDIVRVTVALRISGDLTESWAEA